MRRPFLQRFASPHAALFGSVTMLAASAFLDWLTGPRLDFSLFYLVTICFVTWHAGVAWGYVLSAASALIWLRVNQLTGTLSGFGAIAAWNVLMRFTFFSGAAFLLAGWNRSSRHMAMMVERRTRTLRKVTAELLASEEAERRKLAADMHDAFSQTLSLIKMNLDAARLVASDPAEVERRLSECATMVESVTRQGRTLMFDLYPAMLDDLGLVPTLQWYARQLQERGEADVVATERGARQALHPDVRNYVFRSAKELVTNAVRHGRPREVSVVVHWEPERLRLVVDDDGCGFDPDAVRGPAHAGLGLISIRDRLASLDGRLQIESSPGEGTRVILELPLRTAGSTTTTPATTTTPTTTTKTRTRHAVASAAG